MGGAYAAVAADGDTIFNNPAGLGEIDHFKLTSMSGNLLEDVNYVVLGGVYPLGNRSAVGVGYAGAFVSGIELRDANGLLSRKAGYGSSALLLGFGKKLTEKTSLGINLKYYAADGTEIDAGDEQSWNVDIGLLQKGLAPLSLALVAQNFSVIKAGAVLAVVSPAELNLAFDARLNLRGTKTLTAHGGVEFSPHPSLTLRAGRDENNLTAGLSLKLAGAAFHYAYHPDGGPAGSVGHYFSINLDERGWPPEGQPDTFLGSRRPTPTQLPISAKTLDSPLSYSLSSISDIA